MSQVAVFLLGLVVAAPAAADEPGVDSAATTRTMAAILGSDGFAVVHLDLSADDLHRLVVKLRQGANLQPHELLAVSDELQAWIDKLREAGARDLYMVWSTADLPGHGSLMIPASGRTKADALMELLRSNQSAKLAQQFFVPAGDDVVEEVDGTIFAGSKQALARMKAGKAIARPEVTDALASLESTTAQVLLVPTADMRRTIEEIVPMLPAEIGDGPSTVLTHGAEWAAVGVGGREVALRVIIQSRDEESALRLTELLRSLLIFAGRHMQQAIRQPGTPEGRFSDVLTKVFLPAVSGRRLQWRIDPDNREVAKLLAAIGRPIADQLARRRCFDNLHRIVLALHTYLDHFDSFPAIANFNKEGKPLLSWRVHLLPFLEQEVLYKQFHLNESWDSPHNRTLIEQMPEVYRCPNMDPRLTGKTTYLAPVGESLMFTGKSQGLRIKDIPDGTSNTIFIVDADDAHAVVWTQPEDLQVDLKNSWAGLVGHHVGGCAVAFADGSVHFLSEKDVDGKMLSALFTRNGGEVIPRPF